MDGNMRPYTDAGEDECLTGSEAGLGDYRKVQAIGISTPGDRTIAGKAGLVAGAIHCEVFREIN